MSRQIGRLFSPRSLELSNGTRVKPPRSIVPLVLIIVAILTYLSAVITGFDFTVLLKRGNEFFVVLARMIPPDLTYVIKVINPLLDTLKMSFLGSAIGALLAFPAAVVSSSNINHSKWSLSLMRLFLSVIRTLPVLIIALIATYIFGIGTFAGTVAIAIFTFGIVSKMLYEQIETVDMSAFTAMEAMGLNKGQSFRQAVIPQIMPSYLSIALYSFEINVRYAAILGYVGAGGIGLILDEQIGWRSYDRASTILIMLFIAVVIIETTSRKLRERLM